jgi:hypothetical protein
LRDCSCQRPHRVTDGGFSPQMAGDARQQRHRKVGDPRVSNTF